MKDTSLMSKFRLAHLGLVMAAVGFTAAAPLAGLVSAAHAADTVRADVGKPLQEAQRLLGAGKAREAVAKLKDADAVGNKTEFEKYQIERVRAAAASTAGDTPTAIKAFETLIASGRLSAAEKGKFNEGLAGMYYRAKDYPKAITAIQGVLKDNPGNVQMQQLLTQTYFISGRYNEAAAALKSGKQSEESLQMLANIQLKQNDKTGYVQTIEKLAGSYPKASYWADLLNRVQGKPGFSRTLGLDVLRLRLAMGQLTKPSEFMEMAQLALQAGNAPEAIKIIDQGYKKGALGTGTDAGRHQRLKDLANKTLADNTAAQATQQATYIKEKDSDNLFNMGYAMVSAGKAEGIALMDQAIKFGTARRPEEQKLHYGIALFNAGKKQQAIAALKDVKGTAGESDLARYWTLHINNPGSAA
jgi:predicted Zn-dependent protease